MTPAPPIRVALIGYGLGGSAFHAPFIATTPGLELATIVTRDAERQARAAARYPGARIVGDTDLALGDAAIGLVVISTANRSHGELASRAIDLGRHVVVDKPLVPTAAEARALVERASRRGVVLSVYMNRRWDGDFQTLRALVARGALGTVTRMESRLERWRPVVSSGWREREHPDEAGGLLYDLGSHLIDQALVLFGPIHHVHAELDCRRDGAGVDDDAFVALTHASGVRTHLHMSSVAGQDAPRFRVLGTAAAYVKWGLDVQEAALRQGATPSGDGWGVELPDSDGRLGAGDDVSPIPTQPGDYGAFYRAMARAVRDGGEAPVNPWDAVTGLAVIEAARESATRRATISLDPG